MDKALTHVTGPVADFLSAVKRLFGTEGEGSSDLRDSIDGSQDDDLEQLEELLAKEAFISRMTEAGWSREQAEHKWEAFIRNESISRITATSMGIRGVIAGVWAFLKGANRLAVSVGESGAIGKKGPRLPKRGTTEYREIAAARKRGIDAKKAEELKDIQAGGKGSGVWSKEELEDIRRTGEFPLDARWHHDPTVANRPDLAEDPRIVHPLRGGTKGHLLKGHRGNWQDPRE